jgi:anti-anti-sigma factor
LDAAAVPELEKRVTQIIESGSNLLVFSFKAIDYVSSNGLGLLLAAHRRLERQGGRICLAEVSDEVLHIMEVLGFNRIIRIFPTVESAVQAAVSG